MAPSPPQDGTEPTVTPLVRATRTQAEIDLLPPYGDPEVHIPGELLTYAVVGGVLVGVLERVRR
ncbi:hypothetical protein BRC64_05625 [Halobacteriales archaeon QH_10_67_22]|jgi:hypothetical protein|nr:MAG: hypothetical protein BRC64_05625 [Halobacteriales archaeon QH_10_67_22]